MSRGRSAWTTASGGTGRRRPPGPRRSRPRTTARNVTTFDTTLAVYTGNTLGTLPDRRVRRRQRHRLRSLVTFPVQRRYDVPDQGGRLRGRERPAQPAHRERSAADVLAAWRPPSSAPQRGRHQRHGRQRRDRRGCRQRHHQRPATATTGSVATPGPTPSTVAPATTSSSAAPAADTINGGSGERHPGRQPRWRQQRRRRRHHQRRHAATTSSTAGSATTCSTADSGDDQLRGEAGVDRVTYATSPVRGDREPVTNTRQRERQRHVRAGREPDRVTVPRPLRR